MIFEEVKILRRAALAGTSLLIFFVGCRDLIVAPSDQNYLDGESNNINVADFEQAWDIANSVYPFFQFKHINWDSIHSVYGHLAEKANGDEMFNVLFKMFTELKDGHLEIITKGGYAVTIYLPPRLKRDVSAFDPHVVRKYFTKELKLAGDGNMDYEILPENIGYVRISAFATGDWVFDFDKILDYVAGAKGLIIDVRQNSGGHGDPVNYVVSRFLSASLTFPLEYYKGKPLPNFLVQPRGPYQYTKPVVVLINGVSFSATELFATMMSQLPNVTLVGDTTGGGGGNQGIYSLPSGRQIRISNADFRRYDNQPIEWNGVPPDIVVMQSAEDLKNGHDLQLERAIALLK